MAAEPASIVGDLRDDILAGLFPPGDRLVELRLSERYECDRAAVQAALTELDAEGLVHCEANRGATVSEITLAEAVEITEARAALESLIAGQAARRAGKAERAQLTQIGVDMRAAVAAGDDAAYAELNTRLHAAIRDIGGHTVAGYLVRHLRIRAARTSSRLSGLPGRAKTSLPQHIEIIDAINSGDSERASGAMHAHLLSVIDALYRCEPDAESPPPGASADPGASRGPGSSEG